MKSTTSTSYKDLAKVDDTEKIGTVRIADSTYQLCDHVQSVDNEYYATAFYNGQKASGRDIDGIYYKMMGDVPVALIPMNRLKVARPVYEDYKLTEKMLKRTVNALEGLNKHGPGTDDGKVLSDGQYAA